MASKPKAIGGPMKLALALATLWQLGYAVWLTFQLGDIALDPEAKPRFLAVHLATFALVLLLASYFTRDLLQDESKSPRQKAWIGVALWSLGPFSMPLYFLLVWNRGGIVREFLPPKREVQGTGEGTKNQAATRREECCESMTNFIDYSPSFGEFSDDALVHYSPKFDEYGIVVRDGATSVVAICYCPWCGRALPSSRQGPTQA